MDERCPDCGAIMRWKVEEGSHNPSYIMRHLTGTTTCLIRQVEQIKAKNDKLQKVVDKLPTTKDGVPIVPGLRVFWSSRDPNSSTKGSVIHHISFWNKHKDSEGNIIDDEFNGDAWSYDVENPDGIESPSPLPDDFGLYSTVETLEKAKEKKKEE